MKLVFNDKTMEKLYNTTPILKKYGRIIVEGKNGEGKVYITYTKYLSVVTVVPVNSDSRIRKEFTNKDDAIEYFKTQIKEMFT